MNLDAEFNEVFSEDQVIIENDLKFKSALGIGDKAFKSLQLRENLTTCAEALGVGSSVSAFVSAPTVAGFLGYSKTFLGLSLGAATPVGIVIAAGVLSAGAYVGVAKFLTRNKSDKLLITPKFINTPLDLLAMSLANFFVPISLKIGLADGSLHELEEQRIKSFMIREWGYSGSFITKLITSHKNKNLSQTYEQVLQKFIEFTKSNPDCDFVEVKNSLIKLVKSVIAADGEITENEQAQLSRIENYFANAIR